MLVWIEGSQLLPLNPNKSLMERGVSYIACNILSYFLKQHGTTVIIIIILRKKLTFKEEEKKGSNTLCVCFSKISHYLRECCVMCEQVIKGAWSKLYYTQHTLLLS